MSTLAEKIAQGRIEAKESNRVIRLTRENITKKKRTRYKYQHSYSWYQTQNKVGITIAYGLRDKNDLKVDYQEDKISISFPI